MKFLELCQKTALEAGITSNGPAAVTNQTGILADVVNWVQLANLDIQLERARWKYLWVSNSATLTAWRKKYLNGDLGLYNLNVIDSASINGAPLNICDWDEYKARYRVTGRADEEGQQPTLITQAPNGDVYFHPIPKESVVLDIDYYIEPVGLTDGESIPVLPERYHEAIVQKALTYYATHEDDAMRYNQANREYKRWLKLMIRDLAPKVKLA